MADSFLHVLGVLPGRLLGPEARGNAAERLDQRDRFRRVVPPAAQQAAANRLFRHRFGRGSSRKGSGEEQRVQHKRRERALRWLSSHRAAIELHPMSSIRLVPSALAGDTLTPPSPRRQHAGGWNGCGGRQLAPPRAAVGGGTHLLKPQLPTATGASSAAVSLAARASSTSACPASASASGRMAHLQQASACQRLSEIVGCGPAPASTPVPSSATAARERWGTPCTASSARPPEPSGGT